MQLEIQSDSAERKKEYVNLIGMGIFLTYFIFDFCSLDFKFWFENYHFCRIPFLMERYRVYSESF